MQRNGKPQMSYHNWHKMPLEERLECIARADGATQACLGCGVSVLLEDVDDVFDMPGFEHTFADAADIIAMEGKQTWMPAPEAIRVQSLQLKDMIETWLTQLDLNPSVQEQATWPIYRKMLAEEWRFARMPLIPPWLAQALTVLEAEHA